MNYLERINYDKDISSLIRQICKDYRIGEMTSFKIIEVGYEDLNVIIQTDTATYLSKIFANFRDTENCTRYVNLMIKVIENGIRHPKLYQSGSDYLHTIEDVNLCLMDYIPGSTFFDLKEKPTSEELAFLSNQCALISKVSFETDFVYDSWAIVNFLQEYEKTKGYLEKDHLELISPLVESFKNVGIESLPKTLVHGDIIATNVIKDTNGRLWILDFSVANNYPRIQELVILSCNLGFNGDSTDITKKNIQLILEEYQKTAELSEEELRVFPILLKVAHAMHVIGATQSKVVDNNTSQENLYWIQEGYKGLVQTNEIYQTSPLSIK